MLELLLCSIFTILPDYLFRRYVQGRRFGEHITFYSVWYELRYGITACLMLTVALITVVFYNHPSTSNITSYYRTIPILPETNGRVAEVYVGFSGDVAKGQPIFKLDSTKQEAALNTAIQRIAEVEAQMVMAKAEIAAAEGLIQQAKSAYQQAVDELETKQELQRRDKDIVARREIERLENAVEGRKGGIVAAEASMQAAETRLSTLLPAERASAEAARAEAQVDLDKTVYYAGVSGRVEQFTLRVGDIVNPLLRPAGVLIPSDVGRSSEGRLALFAGFDQVESGVLKVGMAAEVACYTKPWTIIPVVVTQIQDYISAGQVRMTDQLIDPQQVVQPGTVIVILEPMYEGGLNGVTPGSSCFGNAYTNNHEELHSKDIGTWRWLFLHMVDTVSLVHAMILRIHVLVLPVQQLVFSGGGALGTRLIGDRPQSHISGSDANNRHGCTWMLAV